MPGIEKETAGAGWGLARALTSMAVWVLIFIGLVSVFPKDPAGVWTTLIATTVVAGIWWGAAKANHFRALLLAGPAIAFFFAFVFAITGYLIHGGVR